MVISDMLRYLPKLTNINFIDVIFNHALVHQKESKGVFKCPLLALKKAPKALPQWNIKTGLFIILASFFANI